MKIPMTVHAIQKRFVHHDILKHKILDEIGLTPGEDVEEDGMSISKFDWLESKDFTRPWTVILKPYIQQHFDECGKEVGCESVLIHNLWFQQYVKSDEHSWHVHGENYTGVYYLQYPPGSSATQIVDHSGKIYNVDASEGDIIMFPSFFVHRSPPIEHDVVKTIVSFNIEFCDGDY